MSTVHGKWEDDILSDEEINGLLQKAQDRLLSTRSPNDGTIRAIPSKRSDNSTRITDLRSVLQGLTGTSGI